ncbi:MAG: hypothetical protein JST89_21015 [Cyanobacteria bacterium SZAS-4]|nr:hypothetical protein [Cyanobacteria bacterium SZAS-4]
MKQADVGDCFFESSLASLAATPDGQIAIQNMVTKNGDGSYTVKFPGDKNNPVSISEEELKAESASQNGNRTMAIVETAFMKYDKIGPYNSSSISYLKIPLLADINTPGETLELLTGKETAVDVLGGVAQNFDVGATNPANLASFLQNALSNGDPIVATSNFTDAGPLPSMHIFSVLGFDAKTGTVTVRNPWGHNDGIELTSTVDDITNIGDGQLRMPLSTFMMHFNNVAAAGTNQVDNQFNNVANDLKRHANDVVSAGNNLVEGNISAAGQDAVSAMYNAATTVVDTTTGVINTGKNIFYDGLGALFS